MKDHQFALVAIGLSLFTGVVLHLNDVDAIRIIEFIFIENIFLLVLQIYTYVRGDDPYLGEAARSIRRFGDALPLFKTILQNAVAVFSSKNTVIRAKSLEFLNDVNVSLTNLSSGVVDVDLRPGGAFFRELHAGDHAHRTYHATTRADPTVYWLSTAGNILLQRSRHAIEKGVSIKRIFVHPARTLAELQPAIEANKAVGVEVFFVDSDKIETRLNRDFGICDDGDLGVELFVDAKLTPERVRFYLPGAPTADKEISDLKKTWAALSALATPM